MSSQDSQTLRTHAPALKTGSASHPQIQAASHLVEGTYSLPPRRRGKQVDIACDACKRRKSKCDGGRPKCRLCEEKKTECFYDLEARESNKVSGLKRRIATLEGNLSSPQYLLRYLQQAPYSDARELFDKLRDGADTNDLINWTAPSQGSEASSPEQSKSETGDQRRYSLLSERRTIDGTPKSSSELGLALGNSPIQNRTLVDMPLRPGLDSNSPPPDGANWEDTQLGAVAIRVVRHPVSTLDPRSGVASPLARPVLQQPPFLQLCAFPWTRVPLDDRTFSHLICVWLSHHALYLPYVYPTLFLESLQSGQPNESCSKVLVNAILAIACQYSTETPVAKSFDQLQSKGFDFYTEAYALWRAEEGRSSLTTLQALIAMYEYNKSRGKDRFGWWLLHGAVEMASELGICRGGPAEDGATEEQTFGRNFLAWSIYSYQAVESLIYRKLPRLLRCRAVRCRGPLRPSELTEKWQPYKITVNVMRDSYFWEHWNAICSLSEIFVDLSKVLFAAEEDESHVPNSFEQEMQRLQRRIISWHEDLPYALTLEANEMPHNLWLHMNYHIVFLCLYESSLISHRFKSSQPSSMNEDFSLRVTEAASNIARLNGIALEHFGHYGRTLYQSQACAVAASKILPDLNKGHLMDEFLQCIAFLHLQGTQLAFPAALARGLLWLACERSGLRLDADHTLVDVLKYNIASGYLQGPIVHDRTASSAEMGVDMSSQMSVSSRFPINVRSMCRNDDPGTLTGVLENLTAQVSWAAAKGDNYWQTNAG